MCISINEVLALIERQASEPLFVVSYDTAVECLLEAINVYCPTLNTKDMTDEEWRDILDVYLDIIMQCEDGPYVQERAALLDNVRTLRRRGLSTEDFNKLKHKLKQGGC